MLRAGIEQRASAVLRVRAARGGCGMDDDIIEEWRKRAGRRARRGTRAGLLGRNGHVRITSFSPHIWIGFRVVRIVRSDIRGDWRIFFLL